MANWWVVGVISADPQQQDQVQNHVVQSASQPPMTPAEARKFGGGYVEWVLGPYATRAAAGGSATSSNAAGTSKYTGAGGVSANPLAGLFQGALWLRVAEVALGLLLIAVGLARLTHAVPIATRIAEVAA